MSAKKLEKGIDINDLSPVDLRLSIVKTLTAEFLPGSGGPLFLA
jgi:hypothetical protein